MQKLFNKPWFVVVLVLAALATVGQAFLPTRGASAASRRQPTPAAPTPPGPGAMARTETPGDVRNDNSRAASMASVSRDPFVPLAKAAAAVPEVQEARPDLVDAIHLSAIWAQGNATWVLINGQIFQPGAEIGRLRLETATRDGVWVTHAKGRDYLAVGGDFTLHTPAPKTAPPRL